MAAEFDSYSKEIFNIDDETESLLKSWTDEDSRFDLLFRGTRDGFTSESFIRKCVSQGPTLFIVKSEKGNIFGGFASHSWPGKEKSASDSKAFLFSLTHKT